MIEVAIIPARGGSVGLPRKNVRLLGGRPLIGWTIAAARESELFARVIVSTDDAEIAEAARSAGAEVPFMRPPELASGTATSAAVVEHALRALGIEGDFALLQPTSPFRNACHLREAGELFRKRNPSAVVGMAIAKPLAWYYNCDPDSREIVSATSFGGEVTRRQDATPLLHPNGAIYLTSAVCFAKTGSLMPAGALAYPMDSIASTDIDSPEDFDLAEAIVAAGLHEAGR